LFREFTLAKAGIRDENMKVMGKNTFITDGDYIGYSSDTGLLSAIAIS